MGKYDDLFQPIDVGPRTGKYADLFDEPTVTAIQQPTEAQLDELQQRRYPHLSLSDLVNLGLQDAGLRPPRTPEVQTPMATEGVDTGGTEDIPPMSAEDIAAQADLPGMRAPTQEEEFDIKRRELARIIEENLFTPSGKPMEPVIPSEVADFLGNIPLDPQQAITGKLGAESGIQQELAQQIREFSRPDVALSTPAFALPGMAQAFATQQILQMPETIGHLKGVLAQQGARPLVPTAGGYLPKHVALRDVLPDLRAMGTPEFGRESVKSLALPLLSVLGVRHAPGLRSAVIPRTNTMFDRVSGASPVLPPGGRPMPELPPTPQIPGTIAGDVSRALDPNQRRFTMVPEQPPEMAPAPTVEESLARTEQPPAAPVLSQADKTRQILDNRKRILNRIEQMRPLVEQARKLIPGGERELEAEWADLNSQLNNRATNPIVHAPPEVRRTGVPSETARFQPETEPLAPVTPPQEAPVAAPGAPPERVSEPGGVPVAETPQTPLIPPEDAKYAGVQPGVVDYLATKAAEARTRLQGKTMGRAGIPLDPSILSDLAIIGAYHITRVGRDFARWVQAMVKEIGERDPAFWRTLYNKSITQLKEEGQKTEFLKQQAKEARGRLDLSKPENFAIVDQAIPIGKFARDESFILTDSNGQVHKGLIDRKLNFDPKLFDISPPQKEQYRRPANLLGTGIDPKTIKGEKFGVRTFIMYLAAHVQAGIRDAAGKLVNICKFATKDCSGGCLGKGGMGTFDSTKIARANKTKFFYYDRPVFNTQLHNQITKEKARAQADGKQFAIRLNGTSDVLWEKETISGKNLMELHPDVQFYDYTKYPATSRQNLPDNYHMTYSYTGLPGSDAFSRTWADRGVNTAVVFGNGMPAEFLGRPVIDGDVTDLRFQDPQGVIVGLHAKGPLLKLIGQSEFIYDTPPEDVAIPYIDPRTKARIMKNDLLGEDAIDSIKDAAPKAGDLKYKRGNPFLGENVPTESLAPVTPETGKSVTLRGFHATDKPIEGDLNPDTWFTNKSEAADFYYSGEETGGRKFEADVTFQNPLVVSEEQFRSRYGEKGGNGPPYWMQKAWEEGHDGVILTDIIDGDKRSTVFAPIIQKGTHPSTFEGRIQTPKPATPKGFLERKADAARANRAEKIRQGRQLTGLDPSDLTDLAWILADHINRNGTDRFAFDDAAMREAGPKVAPYLDQLYDQAKQFVEVAKQAVPVAPASVPPPNTRATSSQPHVSEVANRYVEERAIRGEIGPIDKVRGIPTDELRAIGLRMPPEQIAQAVSDMMHGGDADLIQSAAVLAKEAQLSHAAGEASRAAKANPGDAALKLAETEAFQDITDFHQGPIAIMKHKWHAQGELFQGQNPIDVSTLNGQREQWLKDTGKPMPAKYEPKMQKAADKLARALDAEEKSGANGADLIEKVTSRERLPSADELTRSLAERLKQIPCV